MAATVRDAESTPELEEVVRAFEDERIPLPLDSYLQIVDLGEKGKRVEVERPQLNHVAGSQIFDGIIKWTGYVNSPKEVYEGLRAAIREAVARQHG